MCHHLPTTECGPSADKLNEYDVHRTTIIVLWLPTINRWLQLKKRLGRYSLSSLSPYFLLSQSPQILPSEVHIERPRRSQSSYD